MHDCSNCSGQCSACGGCKGCGDGILITQEEICVLRLFAQTPFLPVARRADTEEPVFLEACEYTAGEYAVILQHLEAKGLIRIDYDMPLPGADMSRYAHCAMLGSMALTARGQKVLDILEIHGAQ